MFTGAICFLWYTIGIRYKLEDMKPKGSVLLEWSSDLAYALGLLATDGCLSSDGRHIILTSKDKSQIENFMRCVGITNTIGRSARGGEQEKKYFRVQFGDVLFYRFLVAHGIPPRKSKILTEVIVPDQYFFDFLRGHHDGDGSFYAYWDPRWKSSYMFYLVFMSASKKHVEWLQGRIAGFLGTGGRITQARSVYLLRYAKKESLLLLKKMYYSKNVTTLKRKQDKIKKLLKVEGLSL